MKKCSCTESVTTMFKYLCFAVLAFGVVVDSGPLGPVQEGYVDRIGRRLYIKPFPAVDNYQSELYEVIMEPYLYGIGMYSAIANFNDCEGKIKGDIFFYQTEPPGGPVVVQGNITGLPPGKHGIHIHESGDMRNGCEKLGGHFNPYLLQHGSPLDPMRHVGDLGNIQSIEGAETSEFRLLDPVLALAGPRSVVGRALVITEEPDDLGRDGTAESFSTGSTMKPLACAIIAYIR